MRSIKTHLFPTISFPQFTHPPCQYCGKIQNDVRKITRRFEPWENLALAPEGWIKQVAETASRRSETKEACSHTCRACGETLEKGRRLAFLAANEITPWKRGTLGKEIAFRLAGNSHLGGSITPRLISIDDEEMERYIFLVTSPSPRGVESLLTESEKGDVAFFKRWVLKDATEWEDARYKPGTPGDGVFEYTVSQEKLAVYECEACGYREARWGDATPEKQACPVCSFLKKEGLGNWGQGPVMEFCLLATGKPGACGMVKTGGEAYLLGGEGVRPVAEVFVLGGYQDHQAPYYAEGTEYEALLKDGTSQTIFVEDRGLFGESWERPSPTALWLGSC